MSFRPADIAPMLADFGVNATIGAATVRVIFDAEYEAALGTGMEAAGPRCTGATADLAAAVQGTAITINSVAYKVASHQPDGTGITTLVLERAS
jgi:hypothetical protein